MFGDIIGAGIGAIGSIFGGISASKAMKNVKKNVQGQKQANQNWFDRRYNEDATQRADAQSILTRTEEAIKARNKAAEGAAAVMGGTEESVAATKDANARVMADAASQIAVNADRRKDMIDAQYRQRDADLNNELNEMEKFKAGQVTQAAAGVADAGSMLAGVF